MAADEGPYPFFVNVGQKERTCCPQRLSTDGAETMNMKLSITSSS